MNRGIRAKIGRIIFFIIFGGVILSIGYVIYLTILIHFVGKTH